MSSVSIRVNAHPKASGCAAQTPGAAPAHSADVLAPIVVVAGAGYFYFTGGRYESTDDAYVQAARVS